MLTIKLILIGVFCKKSYKFTTAETEVIIQ